MKKMLTICAVAALSLTMLAATATTQKKAATAVEVSFEYERQQGPGSNQYAVWIENEQGEVVRTLFVTSFTTKGRSRDGQPARRGYTYRPACVPTWVTHAKAAEMSDEAIDGVTGATPQSGRQTFSWDMKDAQGRAVPSGTYKVYVEATMFNQSIVTYTGSFSTKDKAGAIKLSFSETERDEQHAGMIRDVQAVLR